MREEFRTSFRVVRPKDGLASVLRMPRIDWRRWLGCAGVRTGGQLKLKARALCPLIGWRDCSISNGPPRPPSKRCRHPHARFFGPTRRGVNARITRIRQGRVSAPQMLAGTIEELDAWRAEDSLAVVKLLSWCIGGTLETTLFLDDLIQRLGSVPRAAILPRSVFHRFRDRAVIAKPSRFRWRFD